jgi:hypothetical protein
MGDRIPLAQEGLPTGNVDFPCAIRKSFLQASTELRKKLAFRKKLLGWGLRFWHRHSPENSDLPGSGALHFLYSKEYTGSLRPRN